MNYIVFDIETYSPSGSDKIDTKELKVSVIGAYYSWIDEYICFCEDEVDAFVKSMLKAELIVGFNHLWFDLPVLQKYANYDTLALPSYDLMVEFSKKAGFKIKLNDLCKANLGEIKTDSYENFKHYYTDKNWFPLIDYCMHDVRLTHELFLMAMEGKKIKYPDLLDTKTIIMDKPVAGKVMVSETPDSIF